MGRKADALIGGKSRSRRGPEVEKCATCGEDSPLNTVHCEGSKLAYGCSEFEPHHGETLWPACWKCGGKMGCSFCVPGGYLDRLTRHWVNQDLVCKRCRVKATLEALLNGGPISQFFMRFGNGKLEWGKIERHTPGLGEYPKAWVRAYALQCNRFGIDPDLDDEKAWRACRKVFESFRIAAIPQAKSKKALQLERNKQVAAAAEQFQASAVDLPERCWNDAKVEG